MSRREEQVAFDVASDGDTDGIGVVYGERNRKRKSAQGQGFGYKFGFVTVLLLLLVVVFGVGFFAGNFFQEPEPDAPTNVYYGKDRYGAMDYALPGMHNYYGRSASAGAVGAVGAAGAFPGNGGNAQNVQARCEDRRCCVGVEGVVGGGRCHGFIDIASCEENADQCEWDCDAARGGRKRVRKQGHRRKYKGKANRGGIFKDFQGLPADPPSRGRAKTWKEYQAAEDAAELDECGDEFEDVLDDEQAQEEFDHLSETPGGVEGSLPAGARRRMRIIGANNQDRITWKTGEEALVGLLAITTSTGSGTCTATKVSKKHIITAGHCCALDGAWYDDWKWYPGVRTWAEQDSTTPIGWTNAWTFTNWFSNGDHDYDMCVITLATSSPSGYLGYGYNTGISTAWTFDYSGYPGSLADSTGIKWGDDACHPSVVAEGQLKYTCDTDAGQSGMSLYKTDTYTVYCIHSWGSSVQNGCARLDATKFNAVKDHIVAGGGYT